MITPHVIVIYRIALIGLVVSALASCSTKQDSGAEVVTPQEYDSACYLFSQNRDSIKLSLRNTNGNIDGRLAFLFYEKDKSRGSLVGKMQGDTLFANYTFTSEGTLSQREVAFLRRGDSFVMGAGEILTTGNRDLFKAGRQIRFDSTVVLKEIPCKGMTVY